MLERNVQAPAELRVLFEETVNADGHVRLAGGTRRVVENDGEPPQTRGVAGWVAEDGDWVPLGAIDHRQRRATERLVLAHRLPLIRDGAARLQAACSGPPGLSPSGWPRSQGCPGSMKPPTSSPPSHSAEGNEVTMDDTQLLAFSADAEGSRTRFAVSAAQKRCESTHGPDAEVHAMLWPGTDIP